MACFTYKLNIKFKIAFVSKRSVLKKKGRRRATGTLKTVASDIQGSLALENYLCWKTNSDSKTQIVSHWWHIPKQGTTQLLTTIKCYSPTEMLGVIKRCIQRPTAESSWWNICTWCLTNLRRPQCKVGRDNTGKENNMGKQGIGDSNNNRDKLRSFCQENNLMLWTRKKKQLWTPWMVKQTNKNWSYHHQ